MQERHRDECSLYAWDHVSARGSSAVHSYVQPFIVDVFPRPIIRNPYLRCTLSFYLVMLVVVLSSTLSLAQETNQGPDPIPNAPTQATARPKSFFARWADFYRQDWSGTAAASPSPPRRGLPSPLDSPPFPNSDWSYGGSPVIGEPDSNSYPLMTAINGAASRAKLYGWFNSVLPVAMMLRPGHRMRSRLARPG